MKNAITAISLTALLGVAGCTTTDMDRMKEMNPFKASDTPAEIVTEDTGTPDTTAPTVTTGSYELPLGGENTFSLAVTGCVEDCPVVNVLLDPDNYWQRTVQNEVTSAAGRKGLYDDVTNVFLAQGFYAFKGTLDIMPGNDATCPTHEAGGQIFYFSLARNGSQRRVNFDTGCQGTASADAAADAINGIVEIRDYMDIVSGNTPGE
ncbi:MAG: hypothetical protein ACRBEQ_06370 [Hyphomonas sp.]